jgi:hypothetical protein
MYFSFLKDGEKMTTKEMASYLNVNGEHGWEVINNLIVAIVKKRYKKKIYCISYDADRLRDYLVVFELKAYYPENNIAVVKYDTTAS